MKLYIPLTLLLWLGSLSGFAQTKSLKIDPEFPPQITVTGTSSLHDWKVTGGGILEVPESMQLHMNSDQGIATFSFKVPVNSLDGGRGASMNTKIYTAFKSDQHPYISYRQTGPAKVSAAAGTEDLDIISTGIVQMAGKEKSLTIALKGHLEKDQLTFKGSQNLKMSDFDMVPPTAMFGQIKTHDDVVVHFEFRYKLSHDE